MLPPQTSRGCFPVGLAGDHGSGRPRRWYRPTEDVMAARGSVAASSNVMLLGRWNVIHCHAMAFSA